VGFELLGQFFGWQVEMANDVLHALWISTGSARDTSSESTHTLTDLGGNFARAELPTGDIDSFAKTALIMQSIAIETNHI
jgi:hypothetical protein